MTAKIQALPVWKKDSTAAEWLQEIAAIAMEYPERFARIVVVNEELNKDGLPVKTRLWSKGLKTNSDIIGALEVAKLETWETMTGRSK